MHIPNGVALILPTDSWLLIKKKKKKNFFQLISSSPLLNNELVIANIFDWGLGSRYKRQITVEVLKLSNIGCFGFNSLVCP